MYNGSLNFGNDDDIFDDFFGEGGAVGNTPKPAGGLSSLFGVKLESPDDDGAGKSSVSRSAAPPNAATRPQSGAAAEKTRNWSVSMAKIVSAFKSVNNENQEQGKLGIALIQCSEFAKIILYRSRENILSTKVLKRDSTVYFKQGYLRYLDDTNDYWSLHFSKDEDRDVFLAKIEEFGRIERESDNTYEEPSKEPSPNIKLAVMDAEAVDDSEHLPAARSTGAISRVAKVGHQLPKLEASKIKSNDSDSSPREVHHRLPTFPTAGTLNSVVRTADQFNASKPEVFAVPNNLLANIMMQQNNTNSSISNFLTESRVNSSESRVHMTKLETKIDRMLDKIELIKLNAASKTDDEKDDEILRLEEKIVELKRENRMLKQGAKEFGSESSGAMETPKDSNDGAAVASLTVDVNEARLEIEDLQKELKIKVTHISELNDKMEKLEAQLEDEKAKATQQTNGGRNDEAVGQNVDVIRGIMNDFYQKIFQCLNARSSWPKQEVLKLAADLIRSETNAALTRQK